MRIAFDSARAGMSAASNQVDRAAIRLARDALPVAAPALAPSGLSGSAPTPLGRLDDDLVGAVPDMVIARASFSVNVASARYVDEAYRSALSLLDHW